MLEHNHPCCRLVLSDDIWPSFRISSLIFGHPRQILCNICMSLAYPCNVPHVTILGKVHADAWRRHLGLGDGALRVLRVSPHSGVSHSFARSLLGSPCCNAQSSVTRLLSVAAPGRPLVTCDIREALIPYVLASTSLTNIPLHGSCEEVTNPIARIAALSRSKARSVVSNFMLSEIYPTGKIASVCEACEGLRGFAISLDGPVRLPSLNNV